MEDKRPLGWVIEVQSPSAVSRRYAVVADDLKRAKALVSDHAGVTNERVELMRVLTEGEVDRLRLSSGEVRAYE
jgi:hypothetical protein